MIYHNYYHFIWHYAHSAEVDFVHGRMYSNGVNIARYTLLCHCKIQSEEEKKWERENVQMEVLVVCWNRFICDTWWLLNPPRKHVTK